MRQSIRNTLLVSLATVLALLLAACSKTGTSSPTDAKVPVVTTNAILAEHLR